MKTLLPIAMLLIIGSSCNKYQYLTLSSDEMVRNEKNQFVVDTDSFNVVFDFYGFAGPLQIGVTNKLYQLLEIDWSRSFLIKGNYPQPLFTPVSTLTGELEPNQLSTSTPSVLLNASITQPSAIQLVPKNTSVGRTSYAVSGGKLLKVDRQKMKKEKITVLGFKKTTWAMDIPKNETPLSFRVYLTLNRGNNEPPIVIDRYFYTSSVMATKAEPQDLPGHLQGNVVVLAGTTAGGAIGTTIGGLALLGGAALIAAASEEKEQ
jgi:hypothetical protein